VSLDWKPAVVGSTMKCRSGAQERFVFVVVTYGHICVFIFLFFTAAVQYELFDVLYPLTGIVTGIR